jgi:L-fuconolactonase
MFGGDWPVVNLAGSYRKWMDALEDILSKYTEPELKRFFHDNAMKVYA